MDDCICVCIRKGPATGSVYFLALFQTNWRNRENMCIVVSKVFRAIGENEWKTKLFGILTDGPASIVEHISDAVSRLQQRKLPGVNWV